ncbi:MAG: beta-glucoside-specific PTS transporter subunit IIABC [Actinomyces sp.]|uniref:beta-glucoside-specific PTS transporter subunit IIABC n=1 Tax=Actinomyces sp. TaxID=29317 RepID=UPI0026DB929D|nr:beta-glucoside-specific PTS transporter subunit IIABC [Actinomyces sp.]MDO4242629.1 beta-glucoside-specific PTS transporter subunit IIABC [Actinomyces sp.]
MAKTDYAALAPQLLDKVGGEANIRSMSHCATRLRLVLADESKAATEQIKALPGVVTVVQAGGQYQVVIGNDVPIVFEELNRITSVDSAEQSSGEEGSLFDRAIKLISALINPIIWPLAGAGLIKAALALALTLGWSDTSTTYTILYAASDSVFYFLPIVLAITAARRFKTSEITAVALAGALVYPDIVALSEAGTSVTFFGIPVVMANYTSSLLPIIVAVWIQGYLERALKKALPSTIRNFTVPMIVLAVMVPLTLITIGPAMTLVSNGLSSGIVALFNTAPWLAGAIMGAFWQVFVMFGVHWGFIPLIMTELNDTGYSVITGPLFAAVLAQAAAVLGVLIRSRNAKLRQIAGPAALSGLLAGITEPGIYGVNLPLKRPFIYGCIGGAVGGVICALGGAATDSFVFPSLIGIPALLTYSNIALTFLGIAVAMVISLTLTLVLGFKDPVEDEPAAADPAPGEPAEPTTSLGAPLAGRAVPLERVADHVFSSGALGNGVGITPEGEAALHVVAPAAGTLVTCMDSGHAYGIKTDDGVELLIHIGLDTVELGGRGFTPAVTAGQRVTRGDLLTEVDLAVLRAEDKDPTTILVVTNSASLAGVVPVISGPVQPGEVVVEIDH